MKKIIISVLSAALVFASCQKEAAPVSSGSSEVSFTATIPQTRTSFAPKDGDSYPVLWTGDEKVSVTYNFSTAKAAAVTASDDGSVATFAVEIAEDAEATAHNFYAVCPSSAQISASKDYQTLTVVFPSIQVPVDGSCDEAAQIIFAKHESTKFDNSVEFAFKHISAYGNLSLKLPSGVSEISSITLTADAEKPLAGRFFYSPSEDTFQASAGSNSITLNTGKTSEVFFACVPVDLSGTVLKVVIAANGTTYTKNIDLTGKTLKFEQGRVSKFSVDMSGVSADAKVVYNLVTDPTTLKVGDKVIIAASNADVALGTTQNTNNRKAESITKDGNTVVNPGAAVQILTLEKGSLDNTCAFNTGSGYLYAASSSKNYLKTQAEIDANASFRVSYADDVTTIKAKGKNTNNLLKYNSGNKLFSCYGSGQVDVVIYSDGKGTGAQLFSTAVDVPSTTPTYSSLAELVKAGEPTGGKVNVTLTNEEIRSIATSGVYRNGIFLQAGDKEIEIYCKDVPAEWEVGGTVSGTLKECTWQNYKGTWELCPASWTELTYKAPAGGGDTGNSFNSTYSYGSLDGWSLSNYTDKSSYYLVPAEGTESVAVISGIFNGKTIASDVVISLNVATFGSGDNPTASTFSIYSNSGCTVSATSAQSGTLPTSSSYTTAVYTVAKTDAAAFTNDLAIKVTCGEGSKQIRLKSINVKFSYK